MTNEAENRPREQVLIPSAFAELREIVMSEADPEARDQRLHSWMIRHLRIFTKEIRLTSKEMFEAQKKPGGLPELQAQVKWNVAGQVGFSAAAQLAYVTESTLASKPDDPPGITYRAMLYCMDLSGGIDRAAQKEHEPEPSDPQENGL